AARRQRPVGYQREQESLHRHGKRVLCSHLLDRLIDAEALPEPTQQEIAAILFRPQVLHTRTQARLDPQGGGVILTQEARQAPDEALDGLLVHLITATQTEQDLGSHHPALIAVVLRYLQVLNAAGLDLTHVHRAHII